MNQRVMIVGANGRIGTELALRLVRRPGIHVTALCRNTSGSALLRMNGVESIHGEFTNLDYARRVLEGCDVVVNLAYRAPRSRSGYLVNETLARNSVVASPPGSQLLFASTIMVYAPDLPIPLPDAYGIEKLGLERLVRRLGIAQGRAVTVLRIGHALGTLQPQSREVLRALLAGIEGLPYGGQRPSNTVFVASIADAVVLAAGGQIPGGTYDLISQPQWRWQDVFEHYAKEAGVQFDPREAPVGREKMSGLASSRARVALAWSPDWLAEYLYGLRLRRKARTLRAPGAHADRAPAATAWRAVGNVPVPGLMSVSGAFERFPLAMSTTPRVLPSGWRQSGCVGS